MVFHVQITNTFHDSPNNRFFLEQPRTMISQTSAFSLLTKEHMKFLPSFVVRLQVVAMAVPSVSLSIMRQTGKDFWINQSGSGITKTFFFCLPSRERLIFNQRRPEGTWVKYFEP